MALNRGYREKRMDFSHIFLSVLSVIVIVTMVVGYRSLKQDLRRDEAIDAAIFLAQRQLDEYVRSTRQSPPKPG
jgi:hypothetical protein